MREEVVELLEGIIGAVESTSYEKLCIWRECTEDLNLSWKQGGIGYAETIGYINDRPVVVSLFVDTVAGYKILFYDPCSGIVDFLMVEEWLKKNLPDSARIDGRINTTDSMNFFNILPRGWNKK